MVRKHVVEYTTENPVYAANRSMWRIVIGIVIVSMVLSYVF